ncbi:MFS transporter [Nakamurella sp. YIM 132087]|uniref:MFS transporter n=1 Tax=Nakamurella alba TaxID=2665158 RepID=A0A7K1FR12_9ACTN|nr:MFS transporter [Nakamurella alba]MTD15683.1 MFS transporter [Nakamurella alba]
MSAETKGFGARFAVPLLLGSVLNPINTTMIAVALVPIGRDLGLPTATVIWLVTGLYLASAVAQPVLGNLADLLGPRRIFFLGTALVAVSGVLPELVPGFTGALLARIGIGIGTSAAYPAALTMIRDQALRLGRPAPQTLVSGLSIAALSSTAVGPVLGGVLIAAFDWRATFLVNVPLALTALVLGILWLPSDRTRPARSAEAAARPGWVELLDPVGTLLFAATITGLLLFLHDLRPSGWWLAVLTLVAGAALVRWELSRRRPFLDLRMLGGNGVLVRTFLRMFVTYLAPYTVLYGLSQWLQEEAGYSSGGAGLIQLPNAILAGIGSILIARVIPTRWPLIVAGSLLTAGAALMLLLDPGSGTWLLVLVSGVAGLGQGFASVANQTVLYRSAPDSAIGAAAGLSRTGVYLSAIVSAAVIGLVYGDRATTGGLHVLALFVLVAAAVALLMAVFDRALPRESR